MFIIIYQRHSFTRRHTIPHSLWSAKVLKNSHTLIIYRWKIVFLTKTPETPAPPPEIPLHQTLHFYLECLRHQEDIRCSWPDSDTVRLLPHEMFPTDQPHPCKRLQQGVSPVTTTGNTVPNDWESCSRQPGTSFPTGREYGTMQDNTTETLQYPWGSRLQPDNSISLFLCPLTLVE